MQTVNDVSLVRDTFLHLRKRRYRCGCGKHFFERNASLPHYCRVTGLPVCAVIRAFEKLVSAKEFVRHRNISGMTAMRYFNCFNARSGKLPEVVSVGEFKDSSGYIGAATMTQGC